MSPLIGTVVGALGVIISGILAAVVALRATHSSESVAHETLDLSVMKGQLETFRDLGEAQARTIDQKDREIDRLQNLINYYRSKETNATGKD